MSMYGIDANAPLWTASGGRARAMLQRFRQQVQSFAQIPQLDQERAGVTAPPEAKSSATELPAELHRMLRRYRQAHLGVDVEPVTYLTIGGPGGTPTTFNADLPADEDLVVLSVTETMASIKQIEVRSHVLVARQRTKE
jgi:hypothetical protein